MSIENSSLSEADPLQNQKHRAKRTAAQRAADLLFIETHAVRGKTQAEIVELLAAERPYRISRSQVAYDLNSLKTRWVAASMEVYALAKAKELRKLDAVEAELWEGWDRSKADGAPGDVAFMRQLLDVHGCRAKLLGLNAPSRNEIAGPGGGPIEIETRDQKLPLDAEAKKALFERYWAMIEEEKRKDQASDGTQSDRN